ncbi:hypothetical protein BDV95DRAFT_612791 [Massariosphaeria phaeospora]|uniref:Uncharacterized protein n=1 Tax=Massariosphaeria phaeospora TaxID=100035 RepID=A0A7C8M0M2_9PLEO|nr:hypothetical protein BDV95DRAFT_612791 [Massariosphaeria phaeospora]
MSSTVEQVNTVYLEKWSETVYSNFALLRFIVDALYPNAETVNEATATKATYVDYKKSKVSLHRAAHKTIGAEVLLIDSGVGKAVQLKEAEVYEDWEHMGSGRNKPCPLENRDAALRVCLAQLWATASSALTYYRAVENGHGIFERMVQFSAWHQAFKLVDRPDAAGNIKIRYFVFGQGTAASQEDNYYDFAVFASAAHDATNRVVVAEMVEVFGAACEHWGAPRPGRWQPAEDNKSGKWPSPVW